MKRRLKKQIKRLLTHPLTLILGTFLAVVYLTPSFEDFFKKSEEKKKEKEIYHKASKATHGGTIIGTVENCGVPLELALIYVPGHSYLVKTDDDGKFHLHYVQPGRYKLLIEVSGKVISSIPEVTVFKGKATQLDNHSFCVR